MHGIPRFFVQEEKTTNSVKKKYFGYVKAEVPKGDDERTVLVYVSVYDTNTVYLLSI